MTYTITIRYYNGHEKTITRNRFDAFLFQAHKAVYDVADRQGLRDTKAAWAALRAAQDMGKGGMSNIKLGQYIITLNT